MSERRTSELSSANCSLPDGETNKRFPRDSSVRRYAHPVVTVWGPPTAKVDLIED